MNDKLIVRKAAAADFQAVSNIMDQVQSLHVEWRPDIYKPTTELLSQESYLQALSDDAFYVAEIDGNVVGVMGIQFRHVETPTHVTRDILFIDSMAVDEPFRGQGVGHAFFDKVREIAAQRNCDGLELQVNARNAKAREMYANYGFTEKSINLELLNWKEPAKP